MDLSEEVGCLGFLDKWDCLVEMEPLESVVQTGVWEILGQPDPRALRVILGARVLQALPVALVLRGQWVKRVLEVFQDIAEILEKAAERVTLVPMEDLAQTEQRVNQVQMVSTELRELLGRMEKGATRAREGHQALTEWLELADRLGQPVKKEKVAHKGKRVTAV